MSSQQKARVLPMQTTEGAALSARTAELLTEIQDAYRQNLDPDSSEAEQIRAKVKSMFSSLTGQEVGQFVNFLCFPIAIGKTASRILRYVWSSGYTLQKYMVTTEDWLAVNRITGYKPRAWNKAEARAALKTLAEMTELPESDDIVELARFTENQHIGIYLSDWVEEEGLWKGRAREDRHPRRADLESATKAALQGDSSAAPGTPLPPPPDPREQILSRIATLEAEMKTAAAVSNFVKAGEIQAGPLKQAKDELVTLEASLTTAPAVQPATTPAGSPQPSPASLMSVSPNPRLDAAIDACTDAPTGDPLFRLLTRFRKNELGESEFIEKVEAIIALTNKK